MLGDFVRPYKTDGQMNPCNESNHLRFFALTRLRRRFPPAAAAAVTGTVTGAGTGAGGGI